MLSMHLQALSGEPGLAERNTRGSASIGCADLVRFNSAAVWLHDRRDQAGCSQLSSCQEHG